MSGSGTLVWVCVGHLIHYLKCEVSWICLKVVMRYFFDIGREKLALSIPGGPTLMIDVPCGEGYNFNVPGCFSFIL